MVFSLGTNLLFPMNHLIKNVLNFNKSMLKKSHEQNSNCKIITVSLFFSGFDYYSRIRKLGIYIRAINIRHRLTSNNYYKVV